MSFIRQYLEKKLLVLIFLLKFDSISYTNALCITYSVRSCNAEFLNVDQQQHTDEVLK